MSASKNADIFFCQIWQILQMIMVITFAGLKISQPYPNLVRKRVKLLDSYHDCSLNVKLKLFQLAVHLTIYSAGIYF